MTRRHRRHRDPLDRIIQNLPSRFLSGTIAVGDGGEMVSLRAYMADLRDHLREVMGTNDPRVVDVMVALGIDPASWYRAALEAEGDLVREIEEA